MRSPNTATELLVTKCVSVNSQNSDLNVIYDIGAAMETNNLKITHKRPSLKSRHLFSNDAQLTFNAKGSVNPGYQGLSFQPQTRQQLQVLKKLYVSVPNNNPNLTTALKQPVLKSARKIAKIRPEHELNRTENVVSKKVRVSKRIS